MSAAVAAEWQDSNSDGGKNATWLKLWHKTAAKTPAWLLCILISGSVDAAAIINITQCSLLVLTAPIPSGSTKHGSVEQAARKQDFFQISLRRLGTLRIRHVLVNAFKIMQNTFNFK